jgi:hypothetical protein
VEAGNAVIVEMIDKGEEQFDVVNSKALVLFVRFVSKLCREESNFVVLTGIHSMILYSN